MDIHAIMLSMATTGNAHNTGPAVLKLVLLVLLVLAGVDNYSRWMNYVHSCEERGGRARMHGASRAAWMCLSDDGRVLD